MENRQMPGLYGTLGPSCQDADMLIQLIRAGMTGLRINLSHGTLSGCAAWLEQVRAAERSTGQQLDLLIDLQGPEIRLGDFAAFDVEPGQLISLGDGGIPAPAPAVAALQPGDLISVDDGAQLWKVLEAEGASALVQVIRGGMLLPRKSLALPENRPVDMPALSDQDYENLALAVNLGIRQVMLPFVHSAKDIQAVRTYWATLTEDPLQIFAKIEDPIGVQALECFMDEVDVIVIARGDLGAHVPLSTLPVLQMEIIRRCRQRHRPFLVVTQMLNSMIHAPVPTRAEVTDIAFAVVSGAAAIMLTGETAMGDYPAEAMTVFADTARCAYEYTLTGTDCQMGG